MKQSFDQPRSEIVRFGKNVIVTSTCYCNVDGEDWWLLYGEPDGDCPNLNNPECSCKLNMTDPSAGNCV